jgi:linoleate 8R-lipoxygenase/9,12-octadecadienoate 8-hydroperoxide 8R-isomerase
MGATISSLPIVKQAQQLINASARPVPGRYGDGRYDADVDPKPTKGSIRQDIESQLERIPQDLDLMIDTAIMNIKDAGYEDDRKYLVCPALARLIGQVEKLIQLIASLPSDSRYIPQITDSLINNLWNVLRHPPLSYLGYDYPIVPRPNKV